MNYWTHRTASGWSAGENGSSSAPTRRSSGTARRRIRHGSTRTASTGVLRRAAARGNDLPKSWNIGYGDLCFVLRPMGFKHTGLFPEQAANWDWFGGLIRRAGRPVKVLNLFAYTGGATLAAAAAGASVVHVDAAKGIVAQAKENAQLSGLAEAPIRWIVDDCKKFVERELRRGNRYDGIIMDPPSYGRGPGGEVWKLEDCIDAFVRLAAQLLSPDALFFLVNSYTTGLSPMTMQYLLELYIRRSRGGALECGELGLPVTQTGAYLPCGASSRWFRE